MLAPSSVPLTLTGHDHDAEARATLISSDPLHAMPVSHSPCHPRQTDASLARAAHESEESFRCVPSLVVVGFWVVVGLGCC